MKKNKWNAYKLTKLNNSYSTLYPSFSTLPEDYALTTFHKDFKLNLRQKPHNIKKKCNLPLCQEV